MRHMAQWRAAIGCTLKVEKCVVIMLGSDESVYQEILGSEPRAAGVRLARSATYLGVEVGPGAHDTQWATVSRKMSARVPDMSAAPSLVGRSVLLSSYVASLYTFKAQFADATKKVQLEYEHALQCSTKAPWQA